MMNLTNVAQMSQGCKVIKFLLKSNTAVATFLSCEMRQLESFKSLSEIKALEDFRAVSNCQRKNRSEIELFFFNFLHKSI